MGSDKHRPICKVLRKCVMWHSCFNAKKNPDQTVLEDLYFVSLLKWKSHERCTFHGDCYQSEIFRVKLDKHCLYINVNVFLSYRFLELPNRSGPQTGS